MYQNMRHQAPKPTVYSKSCISRRAILSGALLVLAPPSPSSIASPLSPPPPPPPPFPSVSPPPSSTQPWAKSLRATYDFTAIEAYWQILLELARKDFYPSFDAKLVWYSDFSTELPSGIPGSPSRAYRDPSCGTFQSETQPYATCPPNPNTPCDTACCRHFAYAVPASRFALARPDRVASVVASPRLAALLPNYWRGILAHELGHCIDFAYHGTRYNAPELARTALNANANQLLQSLDAIGEKGEMKSVTDPEERADVLGNYLLGRLSGQAEQLCYDAGLSIQSVTPSSTRCTLIHFPHPPLSGTAVI